MPEIKFNVNQSVRVKLNEKGWDILREDNARLKASHPHIDWKLPQADEDGYTRWQMWELMKTFGPHISMGLQTPFETNIFLKMESSCMICGGLNLSCPDGCERDPQTGDLIFLGNRDKATRMVDANGNKDIQ